MHRAVIAIAIAAAATGAVASPMRDLDLGMQAFRSKDYESTINHINKLLYPEEQLAQPEDLVAAHVLLGASYFETGKRELAKTEFEKALLLDPNKTLDTLLFSAGVVHLFDDTKEDIAARRKRDEELRKLEQERESLRLKLENARYFERHSYGVNFIPFGAGQFQDHRTGRGVFFAISEGVTFAGSFAVWSYLVNKYGLDCKFCVPLQDVRQVNTLQTIEVGSGIVFLGLYAVGVLDSLLNYRAHIQLNVSPDLLKSLDKPKPPKKTSLLERVHVAPMLTPTSVGIGLGWRN
jgi:tetratricopeptide (TPR) repeat protein